MGKSCEMKIFNAILLAAVLLCLVRCGREEPKQMSGTIADASMHDVTVAAPDGRTVTFGTVDADMSQANGLLLGSPVRVTYRGKIKDDAGTALSVWASPVYEQLVGSWIETTPCYTQGIELEVEGVARSIGMSTLVYESWKLLPDGKLNLRGRSIGDGDTVRFSDDWEIETLDAGQLVIRCDDMTLSFRRADTTPAL